MLNPWLGAFAQCVKESQPERIVAWAKSRQESLSHREVSTEALSTSNLAEVRGGKASQEVPSSYDDATPASHGLDIRLIRLLPWRLELHVQSSNDYRTYRLNG